MYDWAGRTAKGECHHVCGPGGYSIEDVGQKRAVRDHVPGTVDAIVVLIGNAQVLAVLFGTELQAHCMSP